VIGDETGDVVPKVVVRGGKKNQPSANQQSPFFFSLFFSSRGGGKTGAGEEKEKKMKGKVPRCHKKLEGEVRRCEGVPEVNLSFPPSKKGQKIRGKNKRYFILPGPSSHIPLLQKKNLPGNQGNRRRQE